MNILSDPKKGMIQFEGVPQEILQETSPKLTPEERDQLRKERESEGMMEFYGGGRLNSMVSYLKSNSINKIRSREIYLDLEVDQILPMEGQPRQYFDREALDDLKASIAEKGLSNPILVRRSGEQFRLIAGERRWRAFKELGRKKIPAIIKDIKDDNEAYIISAIENLQRQDLNVIEEALCYQKMLDTGAVKSQKELALIVGRNKSKISERLSLLKLPEKVKEMLAQKNSLLSEGHAIELLRLKEEDKIIAIAERAVTEKLSRDDLRKEVNLLTAKEKDVVSVTPIRKQAEPELNVTLEPLTPVETQPVITHGTIEFMLHEDLGFELTYRFQPGLHTEKDLKEIIHDLGKRMKSCKKLKRDLYGRGIF